MVFIVLFIIAGILLAPKLYLWQHMVYFAKTYHILFTVEKKEESRTALYVNNVSIEYKNLKVMEATEAEIILYGIYNEIQIHDSILPLLGLDIQKMKVVYTIYNPLHVKIFTEGKFGVIDGTYTLVNNKLLFELKPSKIITSK